MHMVQPQRMPQMKERVDNICGIGFIINYSNKKLDLSFIRHLFEKLEIRGNEATGYYYERKTKDNGMTRGVLKAPYCASLFWAMTQERGLFEDKKECEKFLKEIKDDKELMEDFKKNKESYHQHKLTGNERLILLHTRLKTTGTELNNLNNHPIWTEKGHYVLVHNGQIHEGYVKKYPYLAQVDSEDILANIETYGISKGLRKIKGTMAIAFKKMTEDTLYIYRNTNPFDLVYMSREKLLIGTSDEKYIKRDEIDEDKPDLTELLINNDYRTITVPSDTLFSINLKKPNIKWEEKIDVPLYSTTGNNFDRELELFNNRKKYIENANKHYGRQYGF